MNDLSRLLEQNLEGAMNRFDDHLKSGDSSVEGFARFFPVNLDLVLAQWAASLDIKTKHEMMKSSIDAIR